MRNNFFFFCGLEYYFLFLNETNLVNQNSFSFFQRVKFKLGMAAVLVQRTLAFLLANGHCLLNALSR